MAGLGDLVVRVGASIEGFEKEMGTVSQRLNAIDRDAQKAFSGFDRLGGRLKDFGTTMTAAISLPLVGATLAISKIAVDFDEAMDQIRSSTGATGTILASLGDSFRGVLGQVPATATQAADVISDLNSRLAPQGQPNPPPYPDQPGYLPPSFIEHRLLPLHKQKRGSSLSPFRFFRRPRRRGLLSPVRRSC